MTDAAEPASTESLTQRLAVAEGLPPRQAALAALLEMHRQHRFAQAALDHALRARAGELSAADAGLAAELAYGVTRHRGLINRLLRRQLKSPDAKIDPAVWEALSLGIYQLIWPDRVPDHAAVGTAVELVKRGPKPAMAGLVNGVLRGAQRGIAQRRVALVSPLDLLRGDLLPVPPGWACQLTGPLVDDGQADPVSTLHAVTSHPAALVEAWIEQHGLEAATAICLHGLTRPALSLRPLRLTTGQLLARLAEAGVTATAHPGGHVVTLTGALPQGVIELGVDAQPQDATAAAVALGMPMREGMTAVELCAGVGTKAIQLAQAVGPTGCVLASDIDAESLRTLATAARRLGLAQLSVAPLHEVGSAVVSRGGADVVLLDVPCSNTGVLARRPEAKQRSIQDTLLALTSLQSGLLDQSATLVKPGGLVAYSTCSLCVEENGQQSAAFLVRHEGWRLEGQRLTLPDATAGAWRDGGYVALLRAPA